MLSLITKLNSRDYTGGYSQTKQSKRAETMVTGFKAKGEPMKIY